MSWFNRAWTGVVKYSALGRLSNFSNALSTQLDAWPWLMMRSSNKRPVFFLLSSYDLFLSLPEHPPQLVVIDSTLMTVASALCS